MTVESRIDIHEDKDGNQHPYPKPQMSVLSHRSISSWIVLVIGGCRVTVDASELHKALHNATNI